MSWGFEFFYITQCFLYWRGAGIVNREKAIYGLLL